jgi:nitrogen fixation NifU-like protein
MDNPVCGDAVRLELRLDADRRVVEAAFEGAGCVLSLSAASMLTEYVHGRTLDELASLTDRDMLDMLGVELGPVRRECALLPLRTLKEALRE